MDAIEQLIFARALAALPEGRHDHETRIMLYSRDTFIFAHPAHPAMIFDADNNKWVPIKPDPFIFFKERAL